MTTRPLPRPLPYPDPSLADGRVLLRRWSETDAECLREAATDPSITEATTVPAVWSPQAARDFVHRQWARAQDGEGVSQAVVDPATGDAVGLAFVGLRPQPHVAGLGYWLVPSARGRGLASAAVRLVVPWAFTALGLHRLEAWVEPGNEASRRVLLGAGFEQEGRLRRFLTLGERTADALVLSVVDHEDDDEDAS